MRLRRVYSAQPLATGSRCTIGGIAANHVRRVLRLRAGDALTLFDGHGGEYEARLEGCGRDEVFVAVGAYRGIERESPLHVTLVQGISRGDRMDLVVQKATELGVAHIVPLAAERSVVRLDAQQSDRRLEHWRTIAIAACEQCGRNRVPGIAAPLALHELLERREPGLTSVLLSPEGTMRVAELPAPGAGLMLLIGPEGGLSVTETAAALHAGFRAVRLGPRVLRTETAAITALSAIQQAFGDL
ncbi:MAG: 16S rRNA (uracil(1498)-N(3))-methyltransferase [Gammaproteobacteria bacterium]|nr:16S rRNA (uracil(1498)-N(3))-methyltransferase [Gammaproteobacteria bacterium]